MRFYRENRGIGRHVCEAVDSAHRSNVLHRDLKPSNIMIDANGYAKVMDFGLARQAKDSLSRLTHQDASGTPAYMAPEQHLGQARRASDVYSLGVCLYEMLTGALPFEGPDFLAQKERMRYPPPRFLAAELPEGIDALMAAALAANPAKRIAGPLDLLERLDGLRRFGG